MQRDSTRSRFPRCRIPRDRADAVSRRMDVVVSKFGMRAKIVEEEDRNKSAGSIDASVTERRVLAERRLSIVVEIR